MAPHTHITNPARCDFLKHVAEVKDLAQTTQQPGQQILANTTAGIQDAVAAGLPNLSAIRRNIRRERQIEQSIACSFNLEQYTKSVTTKLFDHK